jgi:hypothetical protein
MPPRIVVRIATALIAHRRVHHFIGDHLIASRPDALAMLGLAELEHPGPGDSFVQNSSGTDSLRRAGGNDDVVIHRICNALAVEMA